MTIRAIYEPKGPAREYADLACNLYQGCSNGCRYCYVPAILRKSREEFAACTAPRPGIIEALRREAPRYAGRDVFLSFTSDPYPADHATTREAMDVLSEAGVRFTILTKDPERSIGDWDLLADWGRLGTTVTLMGWEWEKIEPNVMPPTNRLSDLEYAKAKGLRTFISIEPLIRTEDAIAAIEYAHDWVDEWWIGAAGNHTPKGLLPPIDLHRATAEIVAVLRRENCKYLLKESLAQFVPEGVPRTNIEKRVAERDATYRKDSERLNRLHHEKFDLQQRVDAAEARVAELEAQDKPLSQEQAEKIEELADDCMRAARDCSARTPCTCIETLRAFRTYVRSLTRPAEAPEKPAPEAPVPDTLKGCWEELQRMGAEVAQLSAGMNFAPLKVRVKCGCSTSVGEFGKTGAAATLSDWQAAVRWARQIKQGVKNG